MENEEKVRLMVDKLSPERKKRMEEMMQQSAQAIKNNGFDLKNQYTVEITEKFDKEEPFQFIWMKLMVNFVPTQFMMMTPQGMQAQMGLMFKVVDMEVYEQSTINDWLDHVQRIKGQNSLYYEKDGEVQNKETNNDKLMIQETKFDEKKNIQETKVLNPNAEEKNKNLEQPEFSPENELTDEQKISEQKWGYVPFFSGDNPVKKSNKEYLDLFSKNTRHFANRIMHTHIYGSFEQRDVDYMFIHQSLVNMVSDFEMCDFTSFTKSELEFFGFTNWRNKSMMIPLWAFPIVLKNNDGLKLIDIHGQEFIVGKDYIEEENKNGCMAIGFPMKKNGNEFELILNYDKTENQ